MFLHQAISWLKEGTFALLLRFAMTQSPVQDGWTKAESLSISLFQARFAFEADAYQVRNGDVYLSFKKHAVFGRLAQDQGWFFVVDIANPTRCGWVPPSHLFSIGVIRGSVLGVSEPSTALTVCRHHGEKDMRGKPWTHSNTLNTQITGAHNHVSSLDGMENVLTSLQDSLFSRDLRGFEHASVAFVHAFDKYDVAYMKTHSKYYGLCVICKSCGATMVLTWDKSTPEETKSQLRQRFLHWNNVSVLGGGKPMV